MAREPADANGPRRIVETEKQEPEVVEAAHLLRPLLRDSDAAVSVAKQLVLSFSYHGPLPPPAMFEGFEKVVPGSAKAILAMAEKEQAHRHTVERREIAYPFIGLWLGALAFAFCIAGAIGLAAYDKAPGLQGLLVSVPIVGAVG